jgi:hypothetical protein
MDTDQQRPLVNRLRRRMLLAIGRGFAPMPGATAYALLPELAERFASGAALDDDQGLAFLAALNDDPELAATFTALAEATAATGAARPSAALARRLAAFPDREPPRLPSGRAVAVARALEAWHDGGVAALAGVLRGPDRGATPGVAAAADGAQFVLREAAAPYGVQPSSALRLVVSDGAGATVELSFAVIEQAEERSRRFSALLRDSRTGAAPAVAWRVLARLGRRRLPGDYVAPGEWALTRALTDEEFARLTVAVHPPAENEPGDI